MNADVDAQLTGFMGRAEERFEWHTAGIQRRLATSEESKPGTIMPTLPCRRGASLTHSVAPSVTDHRLPTHAAVMEIIEPDKRTYQVQQARSPCTGTQRHGKHQWAWARTPRVLVSRWGNSSARKPGLRKSYPTVIWSGGFSLGRKTCFN